MLNEQQLEAKSAARDHYTYVPRLEGMKQGIDVSQLPQLRPGIAGYGITDETVRIYVLDEKTDFKIPDALCDLRTEILLTSGFKVAQLP